MIYLLRLIVIFVLRVERTEKFNNKRKKLSRQKLGIDITSAL